MLKKAGCVIPPCWESVLASWLQQSCPVGFSFSLGMFKFALEKLVTPPFLFPLTVAQQGSLDSVTPALS